MSSQNFKESSNYEELINILKFQDNGLIPVIVVEHKTKDILMFAYMNKDALYNTLKTGKMTYYSRSRKKLWIKGETSGNYQLVKRVLVDCDGDVLLFYVEQKGVACHTGHYSCFYREYDPNSKEIKEISPVIIDPKELYKNS